MGPKWGPSFIIAIAVLCKFCGLAGASILSIRLSPLEYCQSTEDRKSADCDIKGRFRRARTEIQCAADE